MSRLTQDQRLREIARIIESVDGRCLAADGPVTPTRQEITDDELRRIYRLAIGRHPGSPPRSRAGGKMKPMWGRD